MSHWPKIVLIDNYDSFTYIIYQYFCELGADIKVVKNDEYNADDEIFKNAQALIFSPGPGRPRESGVSFEVLAKYFQHKPILGVCLGHQIITEFFGGEVINADNILHGKSSEIFHNSDGIFKDINNPTNVARYHSLIASHTNFPNELIITATTKTNEIMALAHKKYPIFGVQFHPECILSSDGMKMLSNFLQMLDE